MGRVANTILSVAFLAPIVLAGCSDNSKTLPSPDTVASESHLLSETQRLNDWFEARYPEDMMRSPITAASHGLKLGRNDLDDVSSAALEEEYALHLRWLADMKREFNFNRLTEQGKLSYRLFEANIENEIKIREFAEYGYVFDHLRGPHLDFLVFMTMIHEIDNIDDARAYISRLEQARRYLGQFQSRAEAQFENGIVLPKFVYADLIKTSQNVISGAPFDSGPDSPLLADFKSKLSTLKLGTEDTDSLVELAEQSLLASVKPAYVDLVQMFIAQETASDVNDGIWKLPNGDAYYQMLLNQYTASGMSPDEIHDVGLRELKRIQADMREIANANSFKGTVSAYNDRLRADTSFASLVENHSREMQLKNRPERELNNFPAVRSKSKYPVYTNGLSLYVSKLTSEELRDENPEISLVNLTDDAFQSARLAVDTGIHAKKWTREQAVQFFIENTARSEADIRSEVDRIIVWPGRATTYKMGSMNFKELETKAMQALGENFDIVEFFGVVQQSGPLPLPLLEDIVDEWIEKKNI